MEPGQRDTNGVWGRRSTTAVRHLKVNLELGNKESDYVTEHTERKRTEYAERSVPLHAKRSVRSATLSHHIGI